MHDENFRELAAALTHTARSAGELILRYRAEGNEVTIKADGSPVTCADRAAEELILNDLARLMPHALVVGEESAAAMRNAFDSDKPFFLVDPLDGTGSFVKGGSDFTVNIALVKNRVPVFGLIYAPVLERLYLTFSPREAVTAHLAPARGHGTLADLQYTPLRTRNAGDKLTAVVSQAHLTPETVIYMARLPITESSPVSSSMKFVVIAEGKADVYPRIAPTCEWDTAAGHAVLVAAGGCVITVDGLPLQYGKTADALVNPGFVAWGDPTKPVALGVDKV